MRGEMGGEVDIILRGNVINGIKEIYYKCKCVLSTLYLFGIKEKKIIFLKKSNL